MKIVKVIVNEVIYLFSNSGNELEVPQINGQHRLIHQSNLFLFHWFLNTEAMANKML